MRIFSIGSPAQMPGNRALLENAGSCVVNEITITRIVEDREEVGDTTVRYTVGVGSDVSFSEFDGAELLETRESKFWDIDIEVI